MFQGFNPTWRQTFTFTIAVPELAILELKVTLKPRNLCIIPILCQVKDQSKKGRDEHLGSFAARVVDIQQGEMKRPDGFFCSKPNHSQVTGAPS